jgi:PAS domain S-box-containing protein
MRDEVISLVYKGEITTAINIINTRNVAHVLKLRTSIHTIYEFAQNNAMNFKNQSDTLNKQFEVNKFIIIGILLFMFTFITFYSHRRISKYMNKNEHLKGFLSVIRDVNQLIVREKEKQKLIQECCDILASKHVFVGAWIVLIDNANQVEYIAGTDTQKDFRLFKEKIRSGWTPFCVEKTVANSNTYSFTPKSKENCLKCPLRDLYSGKSAFIIALKHNEKVFGYLTLSIDEKHIDSNNDELSLLEEVAGDIAYALNNIDVEESVSYLKELYGNIINSIENIIFVKDTNFNYIACNKSFEKFVGKSRDEVISKSDYDIFDKDIAALFREHDMKMLEEKKTRSNFEWVDCPDGKKAYFLTIKSPLFNSSGQIIGLVGNSVDVTKQKEAEELLSESEEHFKLLMQESPSVIEVYDLDGLQVDVNHAYEVLWGFPASVTLNKFNLFKSKEVEKRGLLAYVKRAYGGENVSVPVYEYDSTGATEAQGQGRVRILNTRIYPLKDVAGNVKNIVITHEDVTDKENTLLQLEQKKMELETIIQEAPNPIMLHNEDGKVILINHAWSELTGYSFEEIDTIDKWISKAHAQEMSVIKKHINTLYALDAKGDKGEYKITTKNGDIIIWQFSSAPLGMIDKKRTVISSAVDITELKSKDDLMIIQSRNAAMGEMISMIAHQWKQPISIISMIANNIQLDVVLGELNDAMAETYSKDILLQTEHLSKTIDDFRNFFKPDKSSSKIRLHKIIDNTYSIIKESILNNNIEFKVLNNSESEIEVYPRELMQVFVNIINNAKDALVSKNVKDAFIEVTIDEDETSISTKICDNGGGIEEELLSKIFIPYFTTKGEKNGTGLGLYMSKMIVEDHHHGTIDVVNRDKGACFTVKLLKSKAVTSGEIV